MHSWFTEGVATADLQDVNACSMNVLVDPRPALTDVQAKYGSQLSEIYGSDRTTRTVHLLTDTRWPIPVAALVIALGWFLTLLPVDASLVIDTPDGLLALFKPQSAILAFSFLGAYLLPALSLRTISPVITAGVCCTSMEKIRLCV